MYEVKTRNWNSKKWVYQLLSVTKLVDVKYYLFMNRNRQIDYDIKFYLETKNVFKAWIVWCYFMLLKYFSGGWTYILLPNHTLKEGYKSIN